jgi:hypothetical protein
MSLTIMIEIRTRRSKTLGYHPLFARRVNQAGRELRVRAKSP